MAGAASLAGAAPRTELQLGSSQRTFPCSGGARKGIDACRKQNGRPVRTGYVTERDFRIPSTEIAARQPPASRNPRRSRPRGGTSRRRHRRNAANGISTVRGWGEDNAAERAGGPQTLRRLVRGALRRSGRPVRRSTNRGSPASIGHSASQRVHAQQSSTEPPLMTRCSSTPPGARHCGQNGGSRSAR